MGILILVDGTTVFDNIAVEDGSPYFSTTGNVFVSPSDFEKLKGGKMPATKDDLLKALQEINLDGVTIEEEVQLPNPAAEIMPVNDVYTVDVDADFYEDFPNVSAAPVAKMPQKKSDKAEKKPKTKTFKADKMADGFMFQANPLAEGKEPFYMEAYIIGNNDFYISGGMAGTLNVEEMKQLRKQLKMVINQMEGSYPNPDPEKGGKVQLKVTAPWLPTDEQKETIAQIVEKEIKKQLEEDDKVSATALKAATNAAVTALTQLTHTPHTANVDGTTTTTKGTAKK